MSTTTTTRSRTITSRSASPVPEVRLPEADDEEALGLAAATGSEKVAEAVAPIASVTVRVTG
ncbi:MAG: hypothetical protein ACREC5_04885 [Thermoplasmata archaeon]